MKKYLLFLLLFLCNVVIAQEQFKFEESALLGMDGFSGSCIQEDRHFFCINYDANKGQSIIYDIDIDTEKAKVVKVIDEESLYSSFVKVDNGYLISGLSLDLSKANMVVRYLDDSFNTVYNFTMEYSKIYSGIDIIKLNGSYYLLNQAVYSDTNTVIKFGNDFSSYEAIDVNDLTSEELDVFKDYFYVYDKLGDEYFGFNFTPFKGGLLVAYTDLDMTDSGFLYYNNGEEKWNYLAETSSTGNVFVSGDYIYYAFEENAEKTYFVKLSENGEKVYETSIDILNDGGRLLLSNFILGKDNNSFYSLSYNPTETNALEDWKDWKLFYVKVLNDIKVSNSDKGEVTLSNDNAFPGEEVEVTVKPKDNFVVDKIIVKDEEENIIDVFDRKFIMPNSKVNIEVIYKVDNPTTSDIGILVLLIILLLGNSLFIKNYKKLKWLN